mmetsp:Transcript_2040/g.7465  ORF Transcript_2040/g.7465 Transcript_2040/m.7465 type:complete len:321 (+) Transcript_2040:1500-2462(+)
MKRLRSLLASLVRAVAPGPASEMVKLFAGGEEKRIRLLKLLKRRRRRRRRFVLVPSSASRGGSPPALRHLALAALDHAPGVGREPATRLDDAWVLLEEVLKKVARALLVGVPVHDALAIRIAGEKERGDDDAQALPEPPARLRHDVPLLEPQAAVPASAQRFGASAEVLESRRAHRRVAQRRRRLRVRLVAGPRSARHTEPQLSSARDYAARDDGSVRGARNCGRLPVEAQPASERSGAALPDGERPRRPVRRGAPDARSKRQRRLLPASSTRVRNPRRRKHRRHIILVPFEESERFGASFGGVRVPHAQSRAGSERGSA